MTRPPVRGDDEFDGPVHAGANDDGWDEDDWEDDEYDHRYDDLEVVGEEHEYEVLRSEGSRGRRVLLLVGIVLGLFAVAVLGLAWFVRSQLDPAGDPGAEVRFNVPSGSSVNAVAGLLEDEGVIADAQIFRWYLRYKGADSFQAGDYLLNEDMAAWDVLEVLSGTPLPIETVNFTVPEGLTLAEVPDAIVEDVPGFDPADLDALIAGGTIRPAALDPSITNLEGFLFPDTYQIEPGQGEEAALQRMAAQFDTVATELQLAERAAALGFTPYEIVTVASLIQEEYGIVEEMPKIARVIYNRLDIGEPLGIDATSRYEAVLAGRDREDIDLESDSPYNTRLNPGLPPTPIALPGRAALEAALAPAEGPWIFYVRDPDESRTPPGGHFFTDSSAEFGRVKDECEEAGLGCG